MKSLLRPLVGAMVLGGLASSSYAITTQGTLGATSQGQAEIIATIGNLVQISGLDTLTFATFTPPGDMVDQSDFCVYRNGATGNYTATVSGDINGGFFLDDDTTGTVFLPYTVEYNGTPILHGATTGTEVGDTTQTDCGLTDNADVQITIAESAYTAVPPDTYRGHVIILINPI